MPEKGSLVFIDGNQAAIVIGEGVDADGQPDQSVIVGLFAGARQIEKGHYGDVPSAAGEHPPSFIPEGSGAVVADAAAAAPAPSAGGLETAEPVQQGTTDTTVTAKTAEDEDAEAAALAERDAEIARLREELAAAHGIPTPPL